MIDPTIQTAAGTFGALLRQRRAAAGLTQEELAERAQMSVRGLIYLEKDARHPYRDTVRRLADALRLTADDRATLGAAAATARLVPLANQRLVMFRESPDGNTDPARTRTNAPLELSSFVGRERELAALTELLGRTRLLTLTGTGGVGKTRLAFRLGAQEMERYPHGVWIVELAPPGRSHVGAPGRRHRGRGAGGWRPAPAGHPPRRAAPAASAPHPRQLRTPDRRLCGPG